MISIAIVDDEQMYLDKEKRITEEYFRRKGQECRIELFQDAEWLLCELEEKKFDIYVLDVEMPGRNGLDAARGIRMLSGYYTDYIPMRRLPQKFMQQREDRQTIH